MNSSGETAVSRPRLESIGLTAGAVTLGLIDGLSGVLGSQFEFSDLSRMILSVLFSTLFFFPFLMTVSLGSRLLAGFAGPDKFTRYFFSAMGFGICLFTLASLNGLIGVRLFRGDLIRLGFFSLVAITAGWSSGHFARRSGDQGGGDRIVRWCLGIPSILSIALLAIWWLQYQRKKAGTVALAIVIVCSALAAFWTLFLLRRLRSKKFAIGSLAVLITLMAIGGVPLILGSDRTIASAAEQGDGSRPPVILISIDTLRADALSVYSDRGAHTPAINALAEDGVKFTRAMSPAPWTLPSVASILTGLPPSVHGVRGAGTSLSEGIQTLGERLKSAGYSTGAIGSNPYLNGTRSLGRGFDEYQMFGGSPAPRKNAHLGAILMRRLTPSLMKRRGTTEEVTQLAREWIRDHREEPFFLWLHYLDPHVPYEPPLEFMPEGTPPPGAGKVFAGQTKIRSGFLVPTIEERIWIRELYLAETRYVDHKVGEILAQLRQSGLYEKSLILLTSDHGEEFWEHDGYEHGHSLHDELLNVPLIIKAPGRSNPGTNDAIVSTESILPTILDLAGISYDEPYLKQRSLSRMVTDPDVGQEQLPVFGGEVLYYENQKSVTHQGHKYIKWLVSGKEALFDLAEDPGEQRPLIFDSHPALDHARALIQSAELEWAALRKSLGVNQSEGLMDRETREQLRSLGYVQ